jgi:hypothetical protein
MSRYDEKKVTGKFYRMTFSIGHNVTEKEIQHVREFMQKLEKQDGIMRCFQNVDRATIKSKEQKVWGGRHEDTDFTIYYYEDSEAKLDKLLFKLKLKFSEFSIHKEETLQSYV